MDIIFFVWVFATVGFIVLAVFLVYYIVANRHLKIALDKAEEVRYLSEKAIIEASILRRQMDETLAKVQRSNRLRERFLSVMTEELEEPLSRLKDVTGRLKEASQGERNNQEVLAEIQATSNVLQFITQDVLRMCKAFQMEEIIFGRCSFEEIFAELKSVYGGICREKKLFLTFTIDHDFPIVLLSESTLRKIFSHVLDTAIQSVGGGGIAITAHAGSHSENRRVNIEIDIMEMGEGTVATANTIAQIFGEEKCSNPAATYVRHLIDETGATLSVESYAGQGVAFRIRIPNVAVLDVSSAEGNDDPDSFGTEDGREIESVVIVEDKPAMLRLLKVYCEALGLKRVMPFSTAREALAYLQNNQADIVMTKLDMPLMSGMELLASMRGKHMPEPVVALLRSEEEVQKEKLTGFSGYITRPVSAEKLQKVFLRCQKERSVANLQ